MLTPQILLICLRLALECLDARDNLLAILTQIEHRQTRYMVSAERAVCRQLEASCQSPVASYATLQGEELFLRALVAAPDGSRIIRAESHGDLQQAEATGISVANSLLKLGASDLLQSVAS